jgi:hypothetical protein
MTRDEGDARMLDDRNEPQVFVVRIWPRALAFRATAREVHREDTIVFEEPGALLRFLVGRLATADDAGGTSSEPASIRTEVDPR